MTERADTPRRRYVLLGASNLALAFPFLVHHVRTISGGPADLFAACGHGRSFGMWSRVMFRGLPGISSCRLWDEISSQKTEEPPPHTFALVTDIGNDLLYGADVPQIAEWVRLCLERLHQHRAQTILSGLPLGSLERLSPARFYVARKLLFPNSRLTFDEMRRRVDELQQCLERLAAEYSATLVHPEADWYGLDPIHIRRRRRAAVWSNVLNHWGRSSPEGAAAAGGVDRRQPTYREALRLHLLQPECHSLFGRTKTIPQPALQENDFRLWLF